MKAPQSRVDAIASITGDRLPLRCTAVARLCAERTLAPLDGVERQQRLPVQEIHNQVLYTCSVSPSMTVTQQESFKVIYVGAGE